MKYLKMLGIAAVAAMSFMAFAASSASATTLEVKGVTQLAPLTITASLEKGTTVTLSRTDGSFANTCTGSHAHGVTASPFTGHEIGGSFTGHTAKQKEEGQKPEDGLSFSGCTNPTTVHDPGTLDITHITGTTNGTVRSTGAIVTTGSPFGTLTCNTGAGVDVGVLKGSAAGHATLEINAVLNCGFLVPSARWVGSYEVTEPTGFGVEA